MPADAYAHPLLPGRLAAWLEAAGAEPALEWREGGHELRGSDIEAAGCFLARWKGEARVEKRR